MVEMDPEEANQNLLQACKDNDEETALEYLQGKEINASYEDEEKWTPLSWVCCNGNEKLAKILIKDHGAASMYIKDKEEKEEEDSSNPFQKPKVASEVGKYTPLHWASYKGHIRIVWMLLKEGLSPLDIDVFGNTAVHQAAASGNLAVLECYLSRGVDIEVKNSRGHTAYDLATTEEIKALISKARATGNCKNCHSKFDFKNIRYYCMT